MSVLDRTKSFKTVCAVVMYEIKYVFILNHDEYTAQYYTDVSLNVQLTLLASLWVFFWLWFSTRRPFLKSFTFIHGSVLKLCWLYWSDNRLALNCYIPLHECTDCNKEYVLLCCKKECRKVSWLILIFLSKEIKDSGADDVSFVCNHKYL